MNKDLLDEILNLKKANEELKAEIALIRFNEWDAKNGHKRRDTSIEELRERIEELRADKKIMKQSIKETVLDNLSISVDTGYDENPIAVLLYTPDMNKSENHFHIQLDLKEAKTLSSWLLRLRLLHL